MNNESVIKDLIQTYQENCGIRLDESAAKFIVCSLMSVRDSERILCSSPKHLFKQIFENKEFNNKAVFPTDIIDLRNVLSNNNLNSLTNIVMFSNSCSERIIKDQKIRVIFNIDPKKIAEKNQCDVAIFGGMAIFNKNNIDIQSCISSIVVDGTNYDHVAFVENIVSETGINCPVYTTSFVPGIDKYKFASETKLFEVNLPSLGVHHEKCRAINPVQALQDVLSIRWDHHPDKNVYKRKPENYEAEFWVNSGFFDSIVKQKD